MDSPWAHPSKTRRPPSWSRIVAGVAGLLLAFTVFIFVADWLDQLVVEEQTAAAASQLSERIAANIEGGLVSLDRTLQLVLGGAQSAASTELNAEQRSALLASRTPKDPQIEFIEVLDTKGNVLATLDQQPDPTNWANRSYFIALRDRPTNDLYIDVVGQEREPTLKFLLVRRITRPDGTFAGVVVVGVRLSYLRDILAQYALGEDETITLLRDDGLVVARQPFTPVGVGQIIDRTSPFFTFMQSGQTPITTHDQKEGELRYVFHKVGRLPLYTVISSPVAGFHPSPVSWWSVPLALGVGALLMGLAAGLWRRLRVPEEQASPVARTDPAPTGDARRS